MNNNKYALYMKLKKHLEVYASQQLAKKLLCLLPIDDSVDLRPLIGNGGNRNNLEAIQTWIKETISDFPTSSFELTLDHWHERLVCELMTKLHTGEDPC
ncbi:hypothetical protein [Terasakiella pusilla]|uniref:hypothetical protein n=1 Tax=Terasakiella pusilla TaxID=64973 RepID=UPI003AA9751A